MRLRSQYLDHEERKPVAFGQGSTLLVEVSIPTGKSLLPRVCQVQPFCVDIQVFIRLYRRFVQEPSRITTPLTSMLKTSRSTESTTRPGLRSSMMRLMVAVASRSKSCQKVKESSKSPKNLKGLKNLQRPSVRRNVYRSTDPPSIRYEELELPLEL